MIKNNRKLLNLTKITMENIVESLKELSGRLNTSEAAMFGN